MRDTLSIFGALGLIVLLLILLLAAVASSNDKEFLGGFMACSCCGVSVLALLAFGLTITEALATLTRPLASWSCWGASTTTSRQAGTYVPQISKASDQPSESPHRPDAAVSRPDAAGRPEPAIPLEYASAEVPRGRALTLQYAGRGVFPGPLFQYLCRRGYRILGPAGPLPYWHAVLRANAAELEASPALTAAALEREGCRIAHWAGELSAEAILRTLADYAAACRTPPGPPPV